jgi:hypothetical protein
LSVTDAGPLAGPSNLNDTDGENGMKKKAGYLMAVSAIVCLLFGNSFGGQQYTGKKGYDNGGSMPKQTFSDIDVNGDGSLNFEEYQKAFPSAEQKGFDFLDVNKDNTLDTKEWEIFTEMHKGMGTRHGKKYHEGEMPDPSGFNGHFGDMDKNGDDQVTDVEFKAYFPGKADTDKVFSAVDADKNGMLDHDEWHDFKAAHGLKHIE